MVLISIDFFWWKNLYKAFFSLNLFQMVDMHLKKNYFALMVGFEAIFWIVGCYEYVLEGVRFFLGWNIDENRFFLVWNKLA